MNVYSTQYLHKVMLNFSQAEYEWLKAHQLYLQKEGQKWSLSHLVMSCLRDYIARNKAKETK